MSKIKRAASGWVNSSFDVDFLHSDSSKKEKAYISKQDSPDIKKEDSFNTINKITYKKQLKLSLSNLLIACEPQKSSELAVSKQKQKEISKWFFEKLGRPNILIISGPAGCGKTTALKVIAKENKFDVNEWITPIDTVDENNFYMRQGEKFDEFIIRATRYSLSDNRRLLLVKDLPNIYSDNKEEMMNLLRKYFQYGKEPLVFVLTETGNSKLLANIFSQEVRDVFKIDLINVNAVTPTSLKNVLKRVSSTLNSKANQILCVTQDKIDEVLSNNIGDVRSALLNLIFCSLKVKKNNVNSECCVREETLGLLHGIGRVINPKKKIVGNISKFVHNPDELASCFQTQSNTFINFVEENFLSTLGNNINGAAACTDVISLADVLNSEWKDNKINKIALSYCIRGVMCANHNPVSSWNPVRKPSNKLYNVQRNITQAEIQWYKNYIESKDKTKRVKELLLESVIEEVDFEL